MTERPHIRRVDFYPADWLAGTGELTMQERGVYVTACALIYNRGGPIARDHLRRQCPGHGRPYARALARLIELGKLIELDGGKLDQNRCETELKNARKRIETSQENGRKRGRESSNFNVMSEPAGSDARARPREGVAKNHHQQEEEQRGAQLGRSAPSASECDRVVEDTITALEGRRGRSRDTTAYAAAVAANKRQNWLNDLARFVMGGGAFTGAARIEALEAIEQARAAGSRGATPKPVRKAVDAIDKVCRRSRRNAA